MAFARRALPACVLLMALALLVPLASPAAAQPAVPAKSSAKGGQTLAGACFVNPGCSRCSTKGTSCTRCSTGYRLSRGTCGCTLGTECPELLESDPLIADLLAAADIEDPTQALEDFNAALAALRASESNCCVPQAVGDAGCWALCMGRANLTCVQAAAAAAWFFKKVYAACMAIHAAKCYNECP